MFPSPRSAVRSLAPLALLVLCSQELAAADRFASVSGSGVACVQSAPCQLSVALAASSGGDRVFASAGSYTGSGDQVALLATGVTLLGGWNGAATGDALRDPVAHESVIDGQGGRRAVAITGDGARIEGFTISRGDATGLAAPCGPSPAGCGGGILVTGHGVTIAGNRISGNVASSAPDAGPQVVAAGGGIMGIGAVDLTIADNVIASNVAHTGNAGEGGGAALRWCDRAVVSRNRFVDNSATTYAGDHGWGGGLSFASVDVLVVDNVFRGNRAHAANSDEGNAVYSWYGAGEVRGNQIDSAAKGSAVLLGYFSGAVVANRVATSADHQALYLFGAATADTIEVTNNVLVGGSGTDQVVLVRGFDNYPASAALVHNTIVGAAGATGVQARGVATVTMTNNIVAGPGLPIQTEGAGVIAADHTLLWDVPAGADAGTNAVVGRPNFLNPAVGDFHIQEGSAAHAAGAAADVAVDFEGDPRPPQSAPDLGADQLGVRAFDFGTANSPVEDGSVRVTPATAYDPATGYGWLSGTIGARDRGEAWSDGLRDFTFSSDATFAVDLPNGRYSVDLWLGDLTNAHDQMAVFIEGLQRGVVTTAAGAYEFPSYPVAVADGQLTIRLKDVGGGDTNAVLNTLYIARSKGVRLDFGSASSPVAQGFERATAAAYTAASGLGWTGGVVATRDRGGSDPLRRDLAFTPRGRFDVLVANGTHDVVVTLGDAASAHDEMAVEAQGAPATPLTLAKNVFTTRTFRVAVADSMLELLLDDLGGKDANVVVNAIEIVPPPRLYFDFGTASSPVSTGFLRVTEKTAYPGAAGYGWSAGGVATRDRGTGGDLKRDFAFTADATFSADVVPGRYEIRVTLGDATLAHDHMDVFVGEELVATVSTAAGKFVTRSFDVQLPSGRLDLRLTDAGGVDANVVINALEIR